MEDPALSRGACPDNLVKMTRTLLSAGAALLFAAMPPAFAQAMQVGDIYELVQSYQTTEKSSEGSSGSSSGHDSVIERVVALRNGGVELDYDLPADTTPEERAGQWQSPARIFKAADGSRTLLNVAELEARLDGWLKAGKLDRSACGRWIFTWNAFRIECDPQAIVTRLAEIDPTAQVVRDGAAYSDPHAAQEGRIAQTSADGNGRTFSATLPIDSDQIRQQRAEADVAIGEISGKPISMEDARLKRAGDQVTGSITVTWETDAAGIIRKRVRTTRTEIRLSDGVVEEKTAIETVERRKIGSGAKGN